MSERIGALRDKNANVVAPKTYTQCIYDSATGDRLDNILANLAKISNNASTFDNKNYSEVKKDIINSQFRGNCSNVNNYSLSLGYYNILSTTTNLPNGFGSGVLYNLPQSNSCAQLLINNNLVYFRTITSTNVTNAFIKIGDSGYENRITNNSTNITNLNNKTNGDYQTFKSSIGLVKKNIMGGIHLTQTVINGITFTPTYDKNGLLSYVMVNGTSTDLAQYRITDKYVVIDGTKSYTVSGGATNVKIMVLCYNSSKSCIASVYSVGQDSLLKQNIGTSYYAGLIEVSKGVTISNVKVYPMMRESTITNSIYEPYTSKSDLQTQITTLDKKVDDKNLTELVVIGDSYTTGLQPGSTTNLSPNMPDMIASKLGLNLHNYGVNGAGYNGGVVSTTYLSELQTAVADTNLNKSKVKYVLILGGRNDFDSVSQTTTMDTVIINTLNYAMSNFPTAEVITVPLWDYVILSSPYRTVFSKIINNSIYSGVRSAQNIWNMLIGMDICFYDGEDHIHPNANGARIMAYAIVNFIHGDNPQKCNMNIGVTNTSVIKSSDVNGFIVNGRLNVNGLAILNSNITADGTNPVKLMSFSEYNGFVRFCEGSVNNGNNSALLKLDDNGDLYLFNTRGVTANANMAVVINIDVALGL